MTWGVALMYYHCPECGKKFSYPLDQMVEFGDEFGLCPKCKVMGVYECDGPRKKDDADYEEIEY